MNTQKTFFAFRVVVHSYNGNAVSVDGVGIIEHAEGKPAQLPEETIAALIRLAHILRPISMRLLASGYNVSNGKLVKIEQKV